ncbi:MAG: GNAT family N-acetyltransferase [Pseudomonadales bacterium]
MAGYLAHLRNKFRHNSPLRLVTDGLRRIGIVVFPYYVMREQADDKVELLVPAGCEIRELTINDIGVLVATRVAYLTDGWIADRFALGDRCLAMFQGEDLTCCCWASRAKANLIFESIDLQENEAYIYAAFTFDGFRGKGHMPILRRHLCTLLAEDGARHMFSIVDALNRPAIRVYEKMAAKRVQLGVGLALFTLVSGRFNLRNYEAYLKGR